jgi:hypothetical protein
MAAGLADSTLPAEKGRGQGRANKAPSGGISHGGGRTAPLPHSAKLPFHNYFISKNLRYRIPMASPTIDRSRLGKDFPLFVPPKVSWAVARQAEKG